MTRSRQSCEMEYRLGAMSVSFRGMIRLKDCFARDPSVVGQHMCVDVLLVQSDGRVRLSPSANATDHSGVSAVCLIRCFLRDSGEAASYSWLCPIFPTHGTKSIATTSISCPKLLGFSTHDAIGPAASTGPFSMQLYRVTMSVVYAVEGSSTLAHHQIVYATDATFTAPRFLLWAKLCASFSQCRRLHYKSINLAFAAISMTSTLSQLHP